MFLKRTVFILAIVTLLSLGLKLSLKAQRDKEDAVVAYDDLIRVEEKIDKMLILIQEKGNREKFEQEINAKLDRLLTNQEKILNELEVVKVRATKR